MIDYRPEDLPPGYQRRSFMASILAGFMAPSIILRPDILMPIKPVTLDAPRIFTGIAAAPLDPRGRLVKIHMFDRPFNMLNGDTLKISGDGFVLPVMNKIQTCTFRPAAACTVVAANVWENGEISPVMGSWVKECV